ncbi:MAG: universal stress protein [Thaumarchaeota archaeon]|nr:universal stress protein [Nitrososphaerota archaeon]
MSKRILVAINETSKGVVEYAIGIAKSTGWDLILLHVVEKQLASKQLEEIVRVEGRDEWVGKAYLTTRLDNIMKVSAPDIWTSGVRYSTDIGVGDPTKKILEVARTLGANMIIAGFVNLKGVERIKAFGSISRKLVENSEIPVLLVPKQREPINLIQYQTVKVRQR